MVDRDMPMDKSPLVAIIDDDVGMREALRDLFESAGLRVSTFGSAPDLPDIEHLSGANCLVLDIRLPRRSGLEVQQQLSKAGIGIPIVFMSGHADVLMTVKAMKAGALDFLAKPFRDQDMLDAVFAAISGDRHRRMAAQRDAGLKTRYASLTAREKEVMVLVTKGLLNKQIAGLLALSEVTVKVHRKHVMSKMGAQTLPALVRCVDALAIHTEATETQRANSDSGATPNSSKGWSPPPT